MTIDLTIGALPQVREALLKNIKRRMTPQPLKIRADVELTCFQYDGIEHIRAAMRAAEATSTEVDGRVAGVGWGGKGAGAGMGVHAHCADGGREAPASAPAHVLCPCAHAVPPSAQCALARTPHSQLARTRARAPPLPLIPSACASRL